MWNSWRPLAFAVLTSCSVGLETPDDARITCTRAQECPAGFECAEGLGYCVNEGTQIPSLQVAFTLPRDGDDEVALDLTGVIVLNMDAKLPTSDVVSLVSADGLHEVPLTVTQTAVANSLIVDTQTLLYPVTDYVLTVHPGIAPVDGLLALPSDASWSVRFKTAASSDVTPPEPVTDVLVDALMFPGIYGLSWTPSASPDAIGVVVLRSQSAITESPVKGRSYAVDQTIGGATVAHVGIASNASSSVAESGLQHYAIFAFDSALNYAPGVMPPVGDFEMLHWCPDHTGHFAIASDEEGTARSLAASNGDARFDSGLLLPDDDIAFSQEATFGLGASPLLLNASIYMRAVSRNANATYLAPSRPFTLPDADLAVTTPGHAELNVTVSIGFKLQTWPAVEAQRDTNPAAGVETWVAATTSGSALQAIFTETGTYRVRVRAIVAGCAPGPWSTSNEFAAGTSNSVYVKAGASGSGLAPNSPAGTLAAVSGLLSSSTAVFVAEGDYSERFELREGVEYFGGYADDFTEANRDPVAHASTFTQPYTVIDTGGFPFTASTVVDGFELVGTNSSDQSGSSRVVYLHNGGNLTLSNNTITAPKTFWANSGVVVTASAPMITHNTISGGIAIWVESGSPSIIDNEGLLGSSYQRGIVHCDGGTPLIRGNLVASNSTTIEATTGIWMMGGCDATIVGNRIAARASAGSGEAAGIQINWGRATIINNEIFAGAGVFSTGIWMRTRSFDAMTPAPGEIIIANNTVHAGLGVGDPSTGAERMGMLFDAREINTQTWTVRVTNNLRFGAGTYTGIVVHDAFPGLKNVENNTVVFDSESSASAVFGRRFPSAPGTALTSVQFGQPVCSPLVTVVKNNQVLDIPTASFLENAGGTDGIVTTLDDNDWRLDGSAPVALRTGGLTLTTGNNCGGTCDPTPVNMHCGAVPQDFDGTTRTPPYSIGAHEIP